MTGGSVTKIGRTYKEWTYIARKTHEKAARTSHENTAYLTWREYVDMYENFKHHLKNKPL
jgi:hypothetical protein